MSWVSMNGMAYLDQFYHKLTGPEEGEKLVFLHGLMGYWANWRGVISSFESKYRILAYDQRGHGRSIQPASGYRPEDFADDLLKILDELKWEQVHLVGHSMGGRNALHFASQFPQRIKKLVIEDIGPVSSDSDVEYFENLFAKVPTPFHNKQMAKDFLYNNFEPTLGAYFYSNIEEKSAGVFDWRFSKSAVMAAVHEGRARDRWDEVKSLKSPTLWLRGEHSHTLSREVFDQILKCNSKVKGVEIKGAGHWIHFEKQAQFIFELQTFLNS